MRKLLTIVASCLLLSSLLGCRAAETGDAAPPTSGEPSARQIAEEVATYERAVGKDHGLTPEKIHQFMEAARAAPELQNRFLGVTTIQKPSDAWIVMEIISDVKPDLIVETGTFRGGSAALWATVLEQIVPDGRVVTIDVEDQRDAQAIELPIWKRRIDFLLGSSTDPEIIAEVRRRAEGRRVLVVLDSLHSREHVAAELEAYAPMVPVGSYVIVQDTPVGPLPAIDAFLAANDSFVADRARERYADTNTVRGYLWRVR